jgi:hypothetical protein
MPIGTTLRNFDLNKLKIKTTPRRAAIAYLTSIHRMAETEGIKVFVQRVEQMKAIIREFACVPIRKVYVVRQACFFAELYCIAVSDLSAALTSMMELNTFVAAYCNFHPSPCSWLFDWMAETYNALQLHLATVGLIQETYLRCSVLPPHYGLLADLQLERCEWLRAWVADDPNQATKDLYQHGETLKPEQDQMEVYISLIRERVSLENVSVSGIRLAHAEDQVFLSYSKYKQCAELLAIRRGDKAGRGEFCYLLNDDLRDHRLENQ